MEEREDGIRRRDIYSIGFYEKSPFYGSCRGLRYRIEGVGGTDEGSERQLLVTTWPGPYNFETTDESLKVCALFAFSNEGLDAVTEYLNAICREKEENIAC